MTQRIFPRLPIVSLLAIAALLALYAPTLFHIGQICWTDDDYSHGLILPIIAAYLIRERARLQIAPALRLPGFGLVLLLGGLLLYIFAQAGESTFLSWISFFPSMIGLLLLITGSYWTGVAGPPLLLLYMAKPLPDSFVPKLFNPLQGVAASVSAYILEQLSVPVHQVGNVLEIPGLSLLVEEACSGMRSVFALVTVALVVILLFPLTAVGQFMIVVAALLLAIIFNVFRVSVTGILSHFYDPAVATGFLHSFTGMITFILGLAALFWLGKLLPAKEVKKESSAKAAELPPARNAITALTLLGCAAAIPFAFSAFLHQTPETGPSEAALTKIPLKIGEWEGKEIGGLDKRSLAILQLDQSTRRIYRNPQGDEIFLYVGYWKTQSGDHQAAKHSPAICLPSNGWTTWGFRKPEFTGDPFPPGKSLQVDELVAQMSGERHLFTYWFFSGEKDYSTEWQALFHIIVQKLMTGRSDGGIVEIGAQMSMDEAAEGAERAARDRTERFVRQLVPYLNDAIGREK